MGADQKTKVKEIVVEDQTSFTDMIHTMNRALRKNKNNKVKPMEDMSFKSDFKRLPSNKSKTSETKKKTITIKINKSFKDEENTEANSPRSQQFNKKTSFGSEASHKIRKSKKTLSEKFNCTVEYAYISE